MSSICGIADLEARYFDFERLRDMGRAMVLRGKDQSGAYISRGVGLQHNRRIGSGDKKCRQPLSLRRGENIYTIVFDGELYNVGNISDLFGFCGFRSFSEAALECYIAFGSECLSHMDGAFAFAIYDESRREVFLARDGMGAKPLYYLNDGRVLVFASEIKGLLRYLRDGVEIDAVALSELVRAPAGMISSEDLYRDIKSLPPSSFAIHSRFGTQLGRYKRARDTVGFSRWRDSADMIRPTLEPPPRDTESLLHEILVAFDRPAFDEYMPSYISALRKRSGTGRAVISDRALLMDVDYALERADRLGMMNGVMVNIVPPEDDGREKKAAIVKTERLLSDIGDRILCDKESHIFRYFGNGIKNSVLVEKDVKKRLRSYGKIIQTEQWLASYPILPV